MPLCRKRSRPTGSRHAAHSNPAHCAWNQHGSEPQTLLFPVCSVPHSALRLESHWAECSSALERYTILPPRHQPLKVVDYYYSGLLSYSGTQLRTVMACPSAQRSALLDSPRNSAIWKYRAPRATWMPHHFCLVYHPWNTVLTVPCAVQSDGSTSG